MKDAVINTTAVLICVLIASLLGWAVAFGIVFTTEIVAEVQQEAEVTQESQSSGLTGRAPDGYVFSKHDSQGDVSLGGIYQMNGLTIHWAGSDPNDERVRPLQVMEATLQRLLAEQKTNLGSDGHARAIIDLKQAIENMKGTAEITPDGPVIR